MAQVGDGGSEARGIDGVRGMGVNTETPALLPRGDPLNPGYGETGAGGIFPTKDQKNHYYKKTLYSRKVEKPQT